MKNKIIAKACEMFLKLGFKSITMDDIAGEMCISKKTIYKYFCNKESLIEETTFIINNQIQDTIKTIVNQEHNAIAENFEIRKMFSEMFKSSDTSPVYQLKKYYPDIYEKVIANQVNECINCFKNNIEKGIESGLYRENIDTDIYVKFYYSLIMMIKENTVSEKESQDLEIKALEYHIRAMATGKGIIELEKQLTH